MQSKSVVYLGYQRFFPRLRRNTEYFSVAPQQQGRSHDRRTKDLTEAGNRTKFSSIQGIQSITTFSITFNFLSYPWFSAKSRLSKERRNCILMTRHYQDLDSAFYRIKHSFNQSEALPKSV